MGAGPEILRDPDRDPHRILKIGTDQPDKGKHKITLDVNQLGAGGGQGPDANSNEADPGHDL